MNFQIKNRFTEAVMFECEMPEDVAARSASRQMGYAVKQAVAADAYLAGAYLAGAYLADANLADANLAGAYLAGAYLADAYLADANLAGAYLADANLADAYLADANLAGAYLAGANLADARNVPSGIESQPETEDQKLSRQERYAQRAARFRERNPEVPVIQDIDERILGVIESGNGTLDMSTWHKCKTTHCMAGWAVTLAGEAGKDLEKKHGPQRAGHMVYTAAIGRTPHFFASNERAIEAMKERIAEKRASGRSPV